MTLILTNIFWEIGGQVDLLIKMTPGPHEKWHRDGHGAANLGKSALTKLEGACRFGMYSIQMVVNIAGGLTKW